MPHILFTFANLFSLVDYASTFIIEHHAVTDKMLKLAITRQALLRAATTTKRFGQRVPSWKGYLWPTTKTATLMQRVSFMSGSNISLIAFPHKPKVGGAGD